jgi:hypothetical protein
VKWSATLAVALAACTTSQGSAPVVDMVSPSRGAAGSTTELTITGSFFAEILTDFRKPSGSLIDDQFTVTLDAGGSTVTLAAVTFVDSTHLTAEVPASAPRGLYDVVVTDSSGRSTTATGAFRIVTSAESVSSFTFDPIDPQHAGVPFFIGLTAEDDSNHTVEGFVGTATVGSVTIGPFVLGRGRGQVVIALPATAVTLTAMDALGHMGTSNAFDVTAGDAARVVFTAGPPNIGAGACGGPFVLQAQDTLGNPATATSAVGVRVDVNPPDGASVFGDAMCMTAASLSMAAGQGTAQFFVQVKKAGRPQLRAVPDAWPSVVRDLDVDAGPASTLAIVSAEQVLMAGMCSQPVVVEAQDAFGNASPVTADVALTPDLEPAMNVTLHADATCGTMLNALTLDAGTTQTQFFFSSASAAMLTLTVDGGTLGLATQSEEVQ